MNEEVKQQDKPNNNIEETLNLDEQLQQQKEENERLKKLLEDKDKEINERELKADFKKQIKDDFKKLSLEFSEIAKDNIESLINFSSKESYKKSYEAVINVIREIKPVNKAGSIAPKACRPSVKNSIRDAFKPPKMN